MTELEAALAYLKGMANAAEDADDKKDVNALRLVIAAAERSPLQSPEYDLVTRLMAVSANDLAFTTNALLGAHERRADQAEVTLQLVRDGILDLIEGKWMPTTHALVKALYPGADEVAYAVITKRSETK